LLPQAVKGGRAKRKDGPGRPRLDDYGRDGSRSGSPIPGRR
jgi:hypothetical protein